MEEYKKTHPIGKKNADPNKPKRPLSSYIIFSNDKREEVKKKNPGKEMVVTSLMRRYEQQGDYHSVRKDVEGIARRGKAGV